MAERFVIVAKNTEANRKCSSCCKQDPDFNSSGSLANNILQLQRTAGNQAVQKLIKSRALQAKLKVNTIGDVYEQEADRIADQMMVKQVYTASNDTPIRIQRYTGQAIESVETAPISVDRALSSPGKSLELASRQDMERRFGRDFSRVRVHDDEAADRSAREIGAKAYTVGSHMVFASDQYAPHTIAGRHLLAHELAHTVQQLGPPGIKQVQRAPWGKCPRRKTIDPRGFIRKGVFKKVRGVAGSLKIYSIAELAAVTYYKQHPLNAGNCVMTNEDLASGNEPGKCKGRDLHDVRLLIRLFHRDKETLRKPRNVRNDPHITERVESLGGAVPEHISAAAILQPDILDVTRREVYDVTTSRMAGRKVVKLFLTYVSRLDDLTRGLPWKAGTRPLQPGPKGGIITEGDYSICYLNTDFEKSPGVIQYIAYENAGKKKDDKKKEDKKKDNKKKEDKKKDNKRKDDKKKVKKDKVKAKEKPKGKLSAGAGNVGVGISISSSSVGGANAGIGISVGSNSAAVGTAGAGISWFSDTAGAGSVGVGVSRDSEAVGAGTLGAGYSKGSTSVGAGTAGLGKSEDSQSAAAGVAGMGEVKDSTTATAGSVGSGKQEGIVGTGRGSSEKKPMDPKGATSSDVDKLPEDYSDAEPAPSKSGTPGGATSQRDKPDVPSGEKENVLGAGAGQGTGMSAKKKGERSGGKGAGKRGTGEKGTGEEAGKAGTPGVPGRDIGTGSGKVDLGVMPIFPRDASDADREKITSEASKVAAMLQKATPAQKLLLQHLANISSSGQYIVPASDWVKKLLNVTKGLTPEEIEYIKNLDWKPGRISEGELRERLRKALANRGKKSSPKSKDHTTKPTPKKVRKGEDGGTSSDAGKITDKNQGASERRSGTKPPSGTKGLSKGITDKVTDPPAGSNRDIKGKFKFKILSGMSKLSILKPNDVVRCRILVNDMGRSFELEGVSITFLSRTDTELISPSGAKYIHTIFNIYFTKDFWSEKYNFYGRGGDVNESIAYDFGFKKVN